LAILACETTDSQPLAYETHHRTASIAGALPVGAAECRNCHEDVQGYGPSPLYHADCESCHGGGSLHSESEDPSEIRFPTTADCLSCHQPGRVTHVQWATGEHARAGLICSDCHNPHNLELSHVRDPKQVSFPRMDPNSKLCVSCHWEVAARFNMPSHHPVPQGMLSCVSSGCHEPHEDRRTVLGAVNSRCASCHQDYLGPWIFEHPPVVEDCGYCHDPHGSITDDLLATQDPAICLSCHTPADDWHTRTGEGVDMITEDFPTAASGQALTAGVGGAYYMRCANCHGAIHGSYQDPHLRR
jgi:DmsE family decaheme c-type cytochrome